MSQVTYYQDASGGWRWRLEADNGEIVCVGESHTSEADARRAFRTAQKNMAAVEDIDGAVD